MQVRPNTAGRRNAVPIAVRQVLQECTPLEPNDAHCDVSMRCSLKTTAWETFDTDRA